jgi:hypothetical protein
MYEKTPKISEIYEVFLMIVKKSEVFYKYITLK